MNTEETTGGEKQPRDPDCFEQWLCERMLERRDRRDEVGRVARWVLRENREGRWAPGPILLARHGHAYDVPAHYERVLRHAENLPDEAVEAFFRVYDLYLADDGAEYDRMAKERGRGGDEEFSGPKTTVVQRQVQAQTISATASTGARGISSTTRYLARSRSVTRSTKTDGH